MPLDYDELVDAIEELERTNPLSPDLVKFRAMRVAMDEHEDERRRNHPIHCAQAMVYVNLGDRVENCWLTGITKQDTWIIPLYGEVPLNNVTAPDAKTAAMLKELVAKNEARKVG